MNVYPIPLIPAPQSLTVTLAGLDYLLTLNYRDTDQGGWILDIADGTGDPILSGVPLVTGSNLLDQYRYLGLGGALAVQTTSDPDAVPTFENLGTDGLLYWIGP